MFDQRMLNREPSDTVGRSSRYRLTILRPSSIQAFPGILARRVDLRQPAPRDLGLVGLLSTSAITRPPSRARHHWEPRPRLPRHRSGHGQRPICSQRKPIYPGHHSTSGIDHNRPSASYLIGVISSIPSCSSCQTLSTAHPWSLRCAYASHRAEREPGALQLRRLIEILHNLTPICESIRMRRRCAAAHERTRSFPRSSRIPMRSSRLYRLHTASC